MSPQNRRIDLLLAFIFLGSIVFDVLTVYYTSLRKYPLFTGISFIVPLGILMFLAARYKTRRFFFFAVLVGYGFGRLFLIQEIEDRLLEKNSVYVDVRIVKNKTTGFRYEYTAPNGELFEYGTTRGSAPADSDSLQMQIVPDKPWIHRLVWR